MSSYEIAVSFDNSSNNSQCRIDASAPSNATGLIDVSDHKTNTCTPQCFIKDDKDVSILSSQNNVDQSPAVKSCFVNQAFSNDESKNEITEKHGTNKKAGENNDLVMISKENDIAVPSETNMDSDEENLEGEPMDMFTALARSSIDIQNKVKKKYKISKTRKAFILFSCFFMQMCLGLMFSMGILYVELLDAFGASRSVTSLVQSLPLGLSYMLGLIVGPLIQKLGLRSSIFCGGLLSATGFIASSFMHNIYAIIGLVGIVTGTGISLFNIGTYTSIPVYFGKQQRIAVAITSFGAGVGQTLWPLINRFLLNHFDWRGTMLITGGILLNVSTLSLLFKPLPEQQKQNGKGEVDNPKVSLRKNFKQLLKIPRFIIFFFLCIFDGFSTPVVGQMIVDFFRVKGYGKDHGAKFLVYYSLSNAIGRAFIAIISRLKVSILLVFALSSYLCGGAFVALAFTDEYWFNFALMLFGGFLIGAHVALTMIVLLKTVGPNLYGLGWGLCATALGTGFTISGPVAGYISVLYSYSISFCVAGFTLIADMTIYLIVVLICKHLTKKQ